MTRRSVRFKGEDKPVKMDRKKGVPSGEPDYYHNPRTNVCYDLDDPTIKSAVEMDEVSNGYKAKIGRMLGR